MVPFRLPTFAPFYLANSPLVGQIGFTNNGAWRMTTTKAYNSLNRLTEISSAPSGSGLCFGKPQRGEMFVAPGPPHLLPSCFSAARRHPRTEGARAFLPARGETDRAAPPKNHEMNRGAVAFYKHAAPLGLGVGCNRPGTEAGGDENGVGLRSAAYSANNVNQYTSRDVPGAVDVMGIGFATNTVTVNGQGVYRKGEYFRKELSVNNALAPAWTNITVNATGQASVSGNALVPKTPEGFTYDADGNLVQDGIWIYTWDAENRLIAMESGTGVPPVARQRLEFAYDWQGRRVEKIVSTNLSGTYHPAYTNRFVYEGWNLVTVLDPNHTPLLSFVWGTDLSGTTQGAGGVGGLLALAVHTGPNAGTYFHAYDGNGNVMALVNAGDGSVAARYEYGPFGELLRATGPTAKANPFRFSAKYQDDETGLLYYGYRFYDPSTGRWPSADPIGELGFELIRSAAKAKRTLDINLYTFVLNNAINNVDYLGLSSLVGQFWAALAAGDLETAALVLEELGASSYPALAAALANAQRIAGLINRISINWQHASRCCRLGNVSLEQATKAIAEVIAKRGTTFKTWVQGGQTMVSGTFTANGVTYSFTGRVTSEGLYQIGTVCEGVHRLAK
jgi:RHS repeat-associated protein